MKNTIIRWAGAPAKWWQFWRPQSGFAGGMVVGLLLTALVTLPLLAWVI